MLGVAETARAGAQWHTQGASPSIDPALPQTFTPAISFVLLISYIQKEVLF